MGQSKSQEHKPPADSASASLSRAHASGVQATTRAPSSLSSGITAPGQAREHARVHTSIEAPRASGAPGPRGPARAHSGVGQGRGSAHDSAANRDTAIMVSQHGARSLDISTSMCLPCLQQWLFRIRIWCAQWSGPGQVQCNDSGRYIQSLAKFSGHMCVYTQSGTGRGLVASITFH